MKKILQQKVNLLDNKKLGKDYFRLTLSSKEIASRAMPGEFVQVKVSGGLKPLLRRPFGIHRVKGKTFEILCQVVGPGTRLLSQKKTGDYLDIIGPLGNGFDYRPQTTDHRPQILVAGGMGVAPLLFLAEKIKQNYSLNAKRYTLVLIGAKNKSEILCADEFKKIGGDVKIATDDGSLGFKGKVTELLENVLRNNEITKQRNNETTIYACGPRPMLEEVSCLSERHRIPAQVSLEAHLACGIGACLGCVVNTQAGYKRVCKEGPVFNAKEIVW